MASLISKASLLMVPSVYEDGTLYNVLPSGNKAPDETGSHNGYDQTRADFTFSRGSNLAATRVNSDGLIEKGRENLLLQSEAFSASWSAFSATATTGQSGYDGTTNALLLTSTGNYARIQQAASGTGIMTASCYMKAGTTSWGMIRVAGSGYNITQYFDLENGVIGSLAGVSASINLVSDGWYRCEVVANVLATPTFYIYTALADGNLSVTDETITIQSPQLEKGLVATTFIPTTSTTAQAGILEDMPRINYDANGENGALLLEPSRTNKFTYSEYFGASDWSKAGIGSGAAPVVTTNYAISPEGVKNAARVQFDTVGTSSGDRSTLAQSFAFTTGDVYTLSCWVKATSGSSTMFHMRINGAQVGGEKIATDEWQLFTETHTATATTTDEYGLQIRGNYSSNTSDILIYGMQLENASYGSSLIPTHGAAVTRGADSCSVTGVSDVIGQSEGTVYLEFEYKPIFDDANSQTTQRFSVSDGSYTNRITFYPNNSDELNVLATGVAFTGSAYSLTEGETYKVALAYGTTSVVYINGTEAFSYGSGTPSGGYNRIQFADATNTLTRVFGSPTKQVALFNERLSNSELADLTA